MVVLKNNNEDEIDYIAIRNNSKQNKLAMESFEKYINASISNVEVHMNDFKSCTISSQRNAISKFMDIENMSRGHITRLCVILPDLDISNIRYIKDRLDNEYPLKEYPPKPEVPEEIKNMNNGIGRLVGTPSPEFQEIYHKYVKDGKEWNELIDIIRNYNQKVESIEESIFDLLDDGLYGDTSFDINTDGVEYLYFKFLNLDESVVKSFIKSLWKAGGSITIGRQVHSDVKRIIIEDTTGILPLLKKNSYEVRIYFESMNDIQKFLSSKSYYLPIFEQYKMMNSDMNDIDIKELYGMDMERRVSNGLSIFKNGQIINNK